MKLSLAVWLVLVSTVVNTTLCVLPLFGFVELLPLRAFVIGCDVVVTNVLLVIAVLRISQTPES